MFWWNWLLINELGVERKMVGTLCLEAFYTIWIQKISDDFELYPCLLRDKIRIMCERGTRMTPPVQFSNQKFKV